MNQARRAVATIASPRRRAALVWLTFGVVVWFFLAMPYAVAATKCWEGREDGKTYQCLKSVAKKLRKDSIIASYATATVAAIIALQLANRNRAEAALRDDGSA